VNDLLREMGLFGKYAPKGENPASYPLAVLSEAQYLAGMKDFKTGPEKDLGERLAPHRKMLKNVEMAYQIITYPILEDTEYGSATRELIRDAQTRPNVDINEHPHRKPIALSLAERKLLGMLTEDRGLPFDPKKEVYAYTDLVARADARQGNIMRRYGQNARAHAIEQGIVRPRDEIQREIEERQAKWRPSGTDKPMPPHGKPQKPPK